MVIFYIPQKGMRRKKRKIFGEENISLRRRRKTEKEKEKNIWRRKVFFGGEENL